MDIKISEKYKSIIKNNPDIIEELLSDYKELREDKLTRKTLEKDSSDKSLNASLKSVLGIS